MTDGRAAYRAGQHRTANPHIVGTYPWRLWRWQWEAERERLTALAAGGK